MESKHVFSEAPPQRIASETKRLVDALDAVMEKFNKRVLRDDALEVSEILTITMSALSIHASRHIANNAVALARCGITSAHDTELLKLCDSMHEATWRNAQARFDDMMKEAA